MPVSYQQAEQVQQQFVQNYFAIYPGLNGVAIGKKGNDFIVCVSGESSQPKNVSFPNKINGVDIIYSWNIGKIIAQKG